MPWKICKVCNSNKWHDAGRSTTCAECTAKGLKWCTSCGIVKPLSEYTTNKQYVHSRCKSCESVRCSQSRRDNNYYDRPEVKAKYKVLSNNRRSKELGTLTTEQWYAICQAFNFECAYCGAKHNITMDHVVPISKGGLTILTNVIPACGSCNSSKQNKDIIEWYTAQPFYDEQRLRNIFKAKGVL